MSVLYLSTVAFDQIEAAQTAIDGHPAGIDGLCLRCRTGACRVRAAALHTLARYGRLPRRRPGASLTVPLGRRPGVEVAPLPVRRISPHG